MKLLNAFMTVVCIIFGVSIGFYLLNSYDEKEKIEVASLDKENLIFFKYKEYESEEEMIQDTNSFSNYIYTNENGIYTVYLAIVKNEKNIEKIKGFFEEKGYIISEEAIAISNSEFIEILEKYETLLENTEKEEVIEAIINQVLEKYEEVQIEN